MIRHIVLNIFLSLSALTGAQNWVSVSTQTFNTNLLEIALNDSVHNELIVSSKFMNKVGSLPVRGVTRWNGIKWDSLAGGLNTHNIQLSPNNGNSLVMDCIPYNGKTLFCGSFASIGGINATGLAIWDGLKWDSLPKRAFKFDNPAWVKGMFRLGNLIYIYGIFNSINGQAASSLGIWDGTNFQPIILPRSTEIWKVLKYKNELYVAGRFGDDLTDTLNNIMRFNGINWYSVGGGVWGSYGEALSMEIYNNELYVGGHIENIGGNPAQNVMKWDGSQWYTVGFGNDSDPAATITKLIVHNNKLFAFGYYQKAAFMPAYYASVFDGTKWCTFDSLNAGIPSATIFQDSICIIGAFTMAGSTPVEHIARLRDENLYKNCNGVGIKEHKVDETISIYPNPVSNTLFLSSEQYFEKGTEIEITNLLGQTVLKLNYSNEIDVSSLPSGCYILKMMSPAKQKFHSKFLKE
jgi:hypothetical protein